VTFERQEELWRKMDARFDQFSLDELRNAESGALTFGIAYPELSIAEREFAEQYFNQKLEKLRADLQSGEEAKDR
jgi:hypothetical protein